ncbi:hypothetical protein Lesp02_01820 [Lentzea sp. NBRC 105346]|uniref:hypothetical protein n=1 Tax=Lentzea sp. NBRC 105346 TaxID=3032205 RepID=UPI0024A424F7|nr:hypothetical protein [Lentzea sp. NBRC 105346]GLZ27992.1 hypothetical protein Lesp02_01820 [Lentzea sp. NBRC 105346]
MPEENQHEAATPDGHTVSTPEYTREEESSTRYNDVEREAEVQEPQTRETATERHYNSTPVRHVEPETGRTPATPLRESVESGNVVLDKAVGDDLLKLLDAQLDEVDAWLGKIDLMGSRPPRFGSNDVATAMSNKFLKRAKGDQDSYHTVITAFRGVLQQTRDTVSDAMRATQSTDRRRGESFRRVY